MYYLPDIRLSSKTFQRRLAVSIRSQRPLRHLPLTPHHRQCVSDFRQPRASRNVTDWRRVVFIEESRFSLSTDNQCARMWKHPGHRYNSTFVVKRHTVIT
ncbi:hypothetical protein TNCV_1480531 [Trichonephila clavipes]|nr:hypothetical protein TNCV_1480531 [Trichonephila clavipes]